MRGDLNASVLCGFNKCNHRATHRTVTGEESMPLCASHTFMLDMEGVPTETLPQWRYVPAAEPFATAK
jgi:hypothetical protein